VKLPLGKRHHQKKSERLIFDEICFDFYINNDWTNSSNELVVLGLVQFCSPRRTIDAKEDWPCELLILIALVVSAVT
jgi:hypothetical protein